MLEVVPKNVARFVHELGQLSLVERSGWLRLGTHVEPLAAHVLRAAQIAFILAHRENHPNPHYVATLAIFHENAEIRTGDPNAISKRYVKADESAAIRDQSANLGGLGAAIFDMWREVEEQSTPAGKIAKDADRLEMAFRARELQKLGHADAAGWLNIELKTASGKELYEALLKVDPNDWWKEICGSQSGPTASQV